MPKPPKGMYCPVCFGQDFERTAGKRPLAGLRVRYLRCKICKARFQSEERLKGVTKPWRRKKSTGDGSNP